MERTLAMLTAFHNDNILPDTKDGYKAPVTRNASLAPLTVPSGSGIKLQIEAGVG